MASSTATASTQTGRVKKTRRVITRTDIQNFVNPHLESPEKARAFLRSMGARFGKNGEITSVRPIKVRISK